MRLKYIASTLLSLAVANAKLIMLIRHGEKLNDNVTNLSEKGQARADCLVEAFGTNGVYATPQKIYAQSPSEKKQSTRPKDTVVPLAKSLGLTIDLSFTSDQVKKLVKSIESSPEEVILVSWSNDKMEDIADKFDIKAKKWKSDVFDDIWVITDEKTPYIKNAKVEITPEATYLGKGNMDLYIVKENVDECITRVIDAINHKVKHPPLNQNNNKNTNNNVTNNNDVNSQETASVDSNLNSVQNSQNQQPTSQKNSTISNSNSTTTTGNNDDITSDSQMLKTSLITISILVIAALFIIY